MADYLRNFHVAVVFLSLLIGTHCLAEPDVTGGKGMSQVSKGATLSTSSAAGRGWQVGPHYSMSLMHPMTFGVQSTISKDWGAYFQYGQFNYDANSSSKIEKMTVGIQHFEVVGNWFPWRSSFHVDSGLGQQTLSLDSVAEQKVDSATSAGEKLTLEGNAEIVSTYLYVGIGWLWKTTFGLFWGTGFGLQLPIASSATFDAELKDSAVLDEAIKATSAYSEFKDATVKAGETIGMLALPRIELLRVGYLF